MKIQNRPEKAPRRKANASPRRRKTSTGDQTLRLRRILVPVDFSDESRKAVAYAIPFAIQFSAAIYLLHVRATVSVPPMDDFPYPVGVRDDPAEVKKILLEFWTEFKESSQIKAVMLCADGRAFHEICECSKLLGVDLIIMPTHGYTGMEHLFLGGTTERVVRHASCPVMVVRRVEHDFI